MPPQTGALSGDRERYAEEPSRIRRLIRQCAAVRKHNSKRRAEPGPAHHVDVTVMGLDRAHRDGKAETGTLVAAGSRLVATVESLEDVRKVLGLDTHAGILNDDMD